MLGSVLLVAARSERMRDLVTSVPLTRRVVDRFVAGDDLGAALEVVRGLSDDGLAVTLDHLGSTPGRPPRPLPRGTPTCGCSRRSRSRGSRRARTRR